MLSFVGKVQLNHSEFPVNLDPAGSLAEPAYPGSRADGCGFRLGRAWVGNTERITAETQGHLLRDQTAQSVHFLLTGYTMFLSHMSLVLHQSPTVIFFFKKINQEQKVLNHKKNKLGEKGIILPFCYTSRNISLLF